MKRKLWVLIILTTILYIPNSYAINQTKDILIITTKAFGRSVDFTSDTTTSTRDKFKVIQAAKSDAATFIASNGKVQGPYLTRAFEVIRADYSEANNMSDLQLAHAVLAVE